MKIVRNKIPDLYQAGQLEPKDQHREYTFRQCGPEEARVLLRLKLAEEIGEVLSAPTQDQLLDELNDLLDVIKALTLLETQGDDEMIWDADDRHRAKAARLGGFDQFWVLV